MRNPMVKAVSSILICTLTQAIILATYSSYFQIANKTYFWDIYVAFGYILLYGYWAFFIPGLLTFYVIVKYIKISNYILHIVLGAFCGLIWSALLLQMSHNKVVWFSFPTDNEWFTLPTYIVVGAIYGLVYRKWLTGNPDSEAI